MKEKEKIKCSKCEKNAVIIEDKIHYCGDCAVKQFIDRVHERLQSKPRNHSIENNVQGSK
jgi:ribosomal protein S26|tara:strand:- start:509 stop:688 length:180 start_codon:yes stop_codon:yes gene_type:complete